MFIYVFSYYVLSDLALHVKSLQTTLVCFVPNNVIDAKNESNYYRCFILLIIMFLDIQFMISMTEHVTYLVIYQC